MINDWDQLNVVNAAKAWYRGIMQEIHWRDEDGRRAVIAALPPTLRRVALMTARLLDVEKRKPPTQPKGRKTKGHLRVVK
jgi:hypothetical protein